MSARTIRKKIEMKSFLKKNPHTLFFLSIETIFETDVEDLNETKVGFDSKANNTAKSRNIQLDEPKVWHLRQSCQGQIMEIFAG